MIYIVPRLAAAEIAFVDFEVDFGEQYPGVIDVWRRAWNDFIPFLNCPPELRRIVYTQESLSNFVDLKSRKVGGSGAFPLEGTDAEGDCGD